MTVHDTEMSTHESSHEPPHAPHRKPMTHMNLPLKHHDTAHDTAPNLMSHHDTTLKPMTNMEPRELRNSRTQRQTHDTAPNHMNSLRTHQNHMNSRGRTHFPFPTDLPTPIHGICTGRNCSHPAGRHLDACPAGSPQGEPGLGKQKRTGSETEGRKKKGITCHDLLQKGEKKISLGWKKGKNKEKVTSICLRPA